MMGAISGRNYLIGRALRLEAHETFEVSEAEFPSPTAMGFERSVGSFVGQLADYRLELDDGRGIHLQEFRGFLRVHWDRVHPTLERWWDHLREDAPEIATLIVIGVIAAIALVLLWMAISLSKGSRARV